MRTFVLDWIIRLLLLAGGSFLGVFVYNVAGGSTPATLGGSGDAGAFVLMASGGGLVGLLVAPVITQWIRRVTSKLESNLHKTPTQDLVVGAFGAIVGLLIAVLLTLPFSQLPYIGVYLPIGFTLFMGYLGMHVAIKKREDLLNLFMAVPRSVERAMTTSRERSVKHQGACGWKVLDTSVIIDGRILDICKSGFIEGTIIVPTFVLEELQRIADSSDPLKRNRGRRGLDVLNSMQKEENVHVQIVDTEPGDGSDVDSRLLRLAADFGAKIITNDFNLNKVAELRGVKVLNINELANALKPVVLPGEEMTVRVIRDGKEIGQGVGYLDDGTMIVIDGGRRYIGEDVGVTVTSVLQTAAGRMIFAKPKAT
ncbi:MAG: PIN/TRAM domain-containing protein [Firmicutes bacterium]|nr:PIN/TRAM domain-containing protein [Bacillota bacterium]MDH7496002.1 PIN/TRAM domain-containing protein [Bacillota bacterium]